MPRLCELVTTSKLDRQTKNTLITEVFGLSNKDIIVDPQKELESERVTRFKALEKELIDGTPLEYVIGKANFYGREFYVDKNTLIPRPETEILVNETIKFLEQKQGKTIDYLDIGTGSGIIPATIIMESNQINICATSSDICPKALHVANKNFDRYNLKVKTVKNDLWENIKGTFDVVTANLPYGGEHDSDYKNLFDPRIALIGGKNGFELIDKFIAKLPDYLRPDGLAILEIGYDQRTKIDAVAKKMSFFNFTIDRDLNGYDRVLKINWKSPHRE